MRVTQTEPQPAEPLEPEAVLEALKALGNPTRLQIMQWLKDPEVHFSEYGPLADPATVGVCVSDLQAKAGLAQSTVSSYMATLEAAGLVISTRVGKWTHYRRNQAQVDRLREAIETSI